MNRIVREISAQGYEALCRTNFHFFLRAAFPVLHGNAVLEDVPYLEAMCYRMQAIEEGETTRLLVTVPPRHLKSIAGSVALVAWMLGRDPGLKTIVTSYGDELSRDQALKFRTLVNSRFYRRLFPATRFGSDSKRWNDQRTTRGGGRRAASLGGAITGLGADVIIIDDLMKAQDALSERRREEAREYFEQTLFSRLNDKATGRIIAIQQRLHEDDFADYLIEKGTFDHLNLPAIADREETVPLYHGRSWRRTIGGVLSPNREPMVVLDGIRDEIGSYPFAAQYLQNPTPMDSDFLRLERMTLIDEPPARETVLRVVQSWDTAVKDNPKCDYSVCTTWGWTDTRWVLLDVFRRRLQFPELKAAALRLSREWRADKIIVEDSSNGTALVQQMRSEGHRKFNYWRVRDSKFERFIAQTDILQSDRIAIPTKTKWFEDLKRELLVFPNGRYDDQVDSITQFLAWAQSRRCKGFLDRDPVTGRPLGKTRR